MKIRSGFAGSVRTRAAAGLLVALVLCSPLCLGWAQRVGWAQRYVLSAEAPAVPELSAAADGADRPSFEELVAPFLERYCSGCHGEQRRPKAGINLARFRDASAVTKNRKVWEKVLKMLVHREMPPERRPQPSEAEREAIGRWIHTELASVDCGTAIDPGRVTIRRLNRGEYNNTVRDLVGVELGPADGFPADDVGYGFDNIGDVLSMPPLLVEKYLEAASEIIERAMEAETRSPHAPRRVEAENLLCTGSSHIEENFALSIDTEGEAFVEQEFAAAGDYLFRVRAYGQQAGPEPARMALRVDGKDVHVVDVAAEFAAPRTYRARAHIDAGKRRISVAYLNNYNVPNHPDPKLRGDRNLVVDWFETRLEGEPDAASRPRILTSWPGDGDDDNACAEEILRGFATRAYRRPVSEDELARLTALFRDGVDAHDSFYEALAVPLKAILAAPHFLFRVELQPEPDDPDAVYPLSQFALASRLSYFLWSSLPDDELFGLAAAGRLADTEVLHEETRRMLADPKARALTENFAGQWLQIRRLAGVSPDPALFPDFDPALREAMETETLLFFETIAREDRSVLEFIDSDYTFVNARLAAHYGIEGVEGEAFQRVKLDGGERGGVLTQGSILTLTSNPTRTSPVKRGLWILEQIFADPPPPPPPGVGELSEEPEAILSGSLRQRMEEHRSNPSCAVCHERMDAIGFAFENFDPVGAWRNFDGEFEIDPAGQLPNGEHFEGPAELKRILKGKAADFCRCLAEKMLTYALGRGLEYYDRCAVDGIVDSLAENDYRFSSLVLGVVDAEPFRKRRGGATEP